MLSSITKIWSVDDIDVVHAEKKQILLELRQCNCDIEELARERQRVDARSQELIVKRSELRDRLNANIERSKEECERFVTTSIHLENCHHGEDGCRKHDEDEDGYA